MRDEATARLRHPAFGSLGVRAAPPVPGYAALSTPPHRAYPHRLCSRWLV